MSDRRVIALAALVPAVVLFIVALAGVALLVAGLASWRHPVDGAAARARTLGGIGLIGGSAGLIALGWLTVERLGVERQAGGLGETPMQRARKFVAVIGILLALICLPFAAAIHTTTHAPRLGVI